MENATKALLIAAGVMFAVMVLSLLLIGYNRISDYYSEKSKETQIEQLAEFNKRFENYNKKNIRGSELISLMNRVIDYNQSQSYTDGTNYKRIGVTIKIGNNDILEQFKYEIGGTANQLLTSEITNKTGTASRTNDENLIRIASTETILINDATSVGINNMTGTNLQKLSSNISNIIIEEVDESDYAIQNRQKRATLLKNLLGLDIQLNNYGKAIKTDDSNKINKIKEITSKYYQYTQFKRARFDCTKMEYDKNSGRVYEMEFVIKTQNGQVVFN